MDISDKISLYAALLSCFSVIIAIFSYLQSRKSLYVTEKIEFEKIKSDVLNDISRVLALLKRRNVMWNNLKIMVEGQPKLIQEFFFNVHPDSIDPVIKATDNAIERSEKHWDIALTYDPKMAKELLDLRSKIFRELKETEATQETSSEALETLHKHLNIGINEYEKHESFVE
jgi:hypothetical protein